MILDEYIEVGVSGRTKQHFIGKGYDIPLHIDTNGREVVPKGTTIKVKPTDLPDHSAYTITAQCDRCGCVKKIKYYAYNNSFQRFGEYYCADCAHIHQQNVMLGKYGVKNPSQLDDVKQKKKETFLDRYGVTSPFGLPEVKEKCIENYKLFAVQNQALTMQQKYEEAGGRDEYYRQIVEKAKATNLANRGVEWPMQSKDVLEKAKQTCFSHYGVEFSPQSPEIQKKIKQTNLSKYGYECNFSDPEYRKKYDLKARQSSYENGTAPVSSQQIYVQKILGGELNYPLENFSLDIYDIDEKIDIEVDFGGHDLQVKVGNLTREEFNHKEMIRESIIRSKGIKILRLISPNDLLPSDEKLKEIYEFAKEYFKTGHTWIKFYIEENKYCNSEHRDNDGAFFNFGDLWNAKILAKKVNKEEVT